MRPTLRTTALALALGAVLATGTPAGSASVYTRIGGASRYATAAQVSFSLFPTAPVSVAYVASGTNFPDALSAGAAAGAGGGPVLLTEPTKLTDDAKAELQRLAPAKIYVVGGVKAVSAKVEDDIDALSGSDQVFRIDGHSSTVPNPSRYDTANSVAETAFTGTASTVYIANGEAFPDALAGSAAGAHLKGPVLLVRYDATTVPGGIQYELNRLKPTTIVILGGGAAVSPGFEARLRQQNPGQDKVVRVSGDDRYRTSVALSKRTYPDGAPVAFLATGANFPDGLAAGPAAGVKGGPVLLTRSTCIPTAVAEEITRLGAEQVFVIGGAGAITDAVVVDQATC